MAKFPSKQQKSQRPSSTESIHLGTLLHTADGLLVLKLEHRDIPYPNAPVLYNRKPVGKVDEIFGPVDDVYVSVKLQASDEFRPGMKFEGYKDKFMFKDRFLPREQVERNKEKRDRQQMPRARKGAPPPRDGKRGSTGPRDRSPRQRGRFERGNPGRH